MKKSKLFVLAMTAMISIGALTGCGGGSDKGGGSKGSAVTLKIGHVEPEDRSTHKALLNFKKNVEEKSKGRLKIEIYPNGALGGDVQLMEAVATGSLDMALPSTSVLTTYSDEFGILDMPYLFKDAKSAFAAMDGDLGTILNKKLEDGNVGLLNLGYNFNGIRNMTNNKRPIKTPDDLKGLKMRCMSNQVYIKMFEALGANATPMSWSELFTALQQGTVDGEENPASLIYEAKFQEVQKYISTTEHIYDFCGIVINRNFYEGMDEQARKILDDAVQTKLIDEQRSMELDNNDEYLKKLQEEGMELTELTAEERKAFADKVAPMYENWETTYGQDIVDAVEKYRAQ